MRNLCSFLSLATLLLFQLSKLRRLLVRTWRVVENGIRSGSKLAIGDGVDIMDPSLPKSGCVISDPKPDFRGALKSEIKVRFSKNFSDFENTLKISWDAEAHASANLAGIAEGNTTLKNFGKLENYLSHQEEGALIIIEASALNGRDFLSMVGI